MASDHPYREILRLVWPLALGMVNNAVMQFVDRAYLARDGMAALEAVLPSSTLVWVFLGFFQSVVCYSGVFVAHYHGAGDRIRSVLSFRAGLFLAVVSGFAILLLIPFGNWIFARTAGSPELVPLECAYYDIALGGGIFLLIQSAALSYFTGCGRTRIVFWVNFFGNLLNIALDPVLIFGWFGLPRMGIAGAALATVFSQLAQAAVFLSVALPQTRDVAWQFVGSPVCRILRFGLPAGGYEILNMLSFTAFVFVTGYLGDVAFATSNACFTVNYLLFAPTMGFALGAQTLVGQARGRGDSDEAVRALRRVLLLGVSSVALACLVVLVLNQPILSLFAPEDPQARGEFLTLGFRLLCLMAVWLLFDTADIILSGALKGAGDTKFVFWWMLVGAFAVWLPLVVVVWTCNRAMTWLWGTMIVYVFFLFAGTALRWMRGRWKSIDLVERPPSLD